MFFPHYRAFFLWAFPKPCPESVCSLPALNRSWLASLSFPLPWSLPFFILLLLISTPQAQNSQQTGFKGNLRLLVKTLEQPHLPFKILPAALSPCLHSAEASTAFPLTLHGSGQREDTLLRGYIKVFPHTYSCWTVTSWKWEVSWMCVCWSYFHALFYVSVHVLLMFSVL